MSMGDVVRVFDRWQGPVLRPRGWKLDGGLRVKEVGQWRLVVIESASSRSAWGWCARLYDDGIAVVSIGQPGQRRGVVTIPSFEQAARAAEAAIRRWPEFPFGGDRQDGGAA